MKLATILEAIVDLMIFIAVVLALTLVCQGQDGYYPEDRGETLAEERARIDAQKTRFAYIPQHSGPMFDGICRLSVDGKQWSGVAISKTRILTVAHHDETGIVRAEFAEREHGSFNRLGIQATILRSNKLADLSVLSYNCPSWAAVKIYPVKRLKPATVSIRGYVNSSPRILDTSLFRTGTVDGYKVNTFSGTGVSGMSGSGVLCDGFTVGIQFGGDKETIDAVTVETIEAFLKE